MDGVTLGPTQPRVLLTAQDTASDNGIYEFVGSGSPTAVTLGASGTDSVTGLVATRIVRATVTGDATATGANGTATSAAVAWLSIPANGIITMTGGTAGGTVTLLSNTGFARVADANQDAEFTSGKAVLVSGGLQNAGVWRVGTIGATVISVPASIPFTRTHGLPLSGLSADYIFFDYVTTRGGRVTSYVPLLHSPAKALF